MDERAMATGHVFISYVREDTAYVDLLQRILEAAGLRVWRDTTDLLPGDNWPAVIRRVIAEEAVVFLACFSPASVAREHSYQHEELVQAIGQLRMRHPNSRWVVPVRFGECRIPDLDIGGGRTLASIQHADLFGDRFGENVALLVASVLQTVRSDRSWVAAGSQPDDAEDLVSPHGAGSAAEFAARLADLCAQAGESLSASESRAEKEAAFPAIADILAGRRLPRWEQLDAILAACALPPEDRRSWQEEWVAVSQGFYSPNPAGGELLHRQRAWRPPDDHQAWSDTRARPWRDERQVILWGPVASGKTCFVAALNMAVARTQQDWTLVGQDEASALTLWKMTSNLIRGRLPEATALTLEHYTFLLSGDAIIAGEPRRVRLKMSIVDVSGELYADRRHDDFHRPELIDALAGCDGILYFYDPLREAEAPRSYEYFHSVIHELEYVVQRRRPDAGRLPHRVAVCVTKLDEPAVLGAASLGGHLVFPDQDRQCPPLVPAGRARLFFEQLCNMSPAGEARPVAEAFRRYFSPDRVRYFATTSLGYFQDPASGFDLSNSRNLIARDDTWGYHIRGAVNPVNVLEPMLWLYGLESQPDRASAEHAT